VGGGDPGEGRQETRNVRSDVRYVRATLLVRDGSIQFPSQVVEKIQRYLLQQRSTSRSTYYDSLAQTSHRTHTGYQARRLLLDPQY
jgi:hypothetical protein